MTWRLWDNTLLTGQAELDEEHEALARLFDLLHDTPDQRRDKAFCSSVLEQIIGQARTHFDNEEQLMLQRQYPKIVQHTGEHAMLLAQAIEYKAAFDAGTIGPQIALNEFPDVWLAFHILFSDKDLARFLAHPG
jgi:hemerythrin-like metal-binding protein